MVPGLRRPETLNQVLLSFLWDFDFHRSVLQMSAFVDSESMNRGPKRFTEAAAAIERLRAQTTP